MPTRVSLEFPLQQQELVAQNVVEQKKCSQDHAIQIVPKSVVIHQPYREKGSQNFFIPASVSDDVNPKECFVDCLSQQKECSQDHAIQNVAKSVFRRQSYGETGGRIFFTPVSAPVSIDGKPEMGCVDCLSQQRESAKQKECSQDQAIQNVAKRVFERRPFPDSLHASLPLDDSDKSNPYSPPSYEEFRANGSRPLPYS